MSVDVLEEVWKEIPDYPRYAISNLGRVMNQRTENIVKPQITNAGILYVPLYGGPSKTKSVKLLVAHAFLDRPDYAMDEKVFATAINKDGDKTNNRVDNLAWRPLWFAVKYSRQFLVPSEIEKKGPVFDTATNQEYENVYAAAVAFGLLFRHVYRSGYAEVPVFPTQQIFSIPQPIHVR